MHRPPSFKTLRKVNVRKKKYVQTLQHTKTCDDKMPYTCVNPYERKSGNASKSPAYKKQRQKACLKVARGFYDDNDLTLCRNECHTKGSGLKKSQKFDDLSKKFSARIIQAARARRFGSKPTTRTMDMNRKRCSPGQKRTSPRGEIPIVCSGEKRRRQMKQKERRCLYGENPNSKKVPKACLTKKQAERVLGVTIVPNGEKGGNYDPDED